MGHASVGLTFAVDAGGERAIELRSGTGDRSPGAPTQPPVRAPGTAPAAPGPAGAGVLRRLGRLGSRTNADERPNLLVDSLAPLNQAVLAIRWGTTAVSLAVASPEMADGQARYLACAVVLLGYTVLRTLSPIRYGDATSGLLRVLGEAVLTVVMVTLTGYWDSPFAFSLLTAIVLAGFARGFGISLQVAAVMAFAITVLWDLNEALTDEEVRTSLQWTVELLLVALIAGFARRILGEADQRQSQALDRLGRLSDANGLLFQLHQVTQTLPASLDLDEALDTTLNQLRELFEYDSVAIIVFDDSDLQWHTLRRERGRPPETMSQEMLPRPLARAVRLRSIVSEQNLLASGGPGLNPGSASGLYAVLPARGSIIGLIAIEHGDSHHFTERDAELLNGFVEPAALAVDNARWFRRLRTVGADEERTRIARDLHDRIGQSLAYMAFELDRIVRNRSTDDPTTQALDDLRNDVRLVVGEVRDTLYDLRTDVTESQSLVETVGAFLERVEERGGLDTNLWAEETARLPILQEREMWRIAQEAVTNAERHAQATRVALSWRCNGRQASLEVADDGVGFPVDQAGRFDSYGLVGMRERAASIGATLAIDSEPGRGTRIRCTLDAR